MTRRTTSAEEVASRRYDATNIKVLPGLNAIRQSPAMFAGSTGAEGVLQLVNEAVDNAIDEVRSNFCDWLQVCLKPDGSFVVEDNGRGIPVDLHEKEGIPAVEVVLTRLHAGGKFSNDGTYVRPSGLHGVGISCVNALSEWLEVDIWRDGFHYRQRYARGSPESTLRTLGTSRKRGTRIRFLPDKLIFDEATDFSHLQLAHRLEELAFLHPGAVIELDDCRRGQRQRFQFVSGILGLLDRLNESRICLHAPPIRIHHNAGDLELEVALQWTESYGDCIKSFVNGANTIHGGTHVAGLRSALSHAMNEYACEKGLLDEHAGDRMTAFDVAEGLTAVLSLSLDLPSFEGQTKSRFTRHAAQQRVETAVYERFRKVLRSESKVATAVIGRALEVLRARRSIRRVCDKNRFEQKNIEVDAEVYKRQFSIRSTNWHDSALWITDEQLLECHASLCKVEEESVGLDVCCGSGIVGAAFKGKVSKMVGLDLTPAMVALAETRLDEVHQGTVYDMPFEDATFDLVVTREVLHILPQPGAPVAEIFRVLRPGGQFITGQILPYGEQDAVWMYRIFKKKQPLIFSMFQEEDFRRLLLEGGFVNLEMQEYLQWESIDLWISTHETTPLHRREIRDLFLHAPREARCIHPFEVLPSGEIRDQWRWCVFSAHKPT